MSEITNAALEMAPYAGAAIGYGAGRILEATAVNHIDQNRRALVGSYEGRGSQMASRPKVWERVTPTLAVVAAVAGFAVGEAVQTNEMTIGTKPVIELSVDHTYRTQEDGTVDAINTVATTIMQSRAISARALLAHNGAYDSVTSPNQVEADPPYGHTGSLSKATGDAISRAYASSEPAITNAIGNNTGHNAGVLVVTGGSRIGESRTVIERAKDNGNIPVFIADAGPENTPTAKELQTIAKETHGQYWHVPKQTDGIEEKISKTIIPPEIKVKDDGQRNVLIGIAGVLAVSMSLQFARRRQATTGETRVA
jgi:hypothetical protein